MSPLATSDHCQITSNISLCIRKQACIIRLVWFFSRTDWNGLNEAIIDYDWNICFTTDDINQISSRFTESLLNLARQFIPNKVVTIRPHDKPWYSGDPVSDRLTKRTIPEYGPPFVSPKYFPIHIMYYQIQKADRPAIRDTDHPFSVPNHKRTRKTDQQKK